MLALALVIVAGCAAPEIVLERQADRDKRGDEGLAALGGGVAAIGLTNAHKANGDLALYDTTPAALVDGRRYPLFVDVNRGLILGASNATIGSVQLAASSAAIGGVDVEELPTEAALADNTANPTTSHLGADLFAYDGATWDRVTNGNGVAATALRVSIASDSTGQVALAAGTASIGSVGAIVNELPAGTQNIGDVDVLTINGQAPAFGAGVVGATVQRVTVATDDVVSVDWNGTAPPIGAGLEATALRVTLATDSTGLVSVDDNAGSLTVDNAQLSVVGGGAEATAMRVTIANDSTGVVSVDDNGAALTVDWAGTAPPIGAGLEATALRVTLATDSTGLVSVDDGAGALTVDWAGTAPPIGAGLEATALRVTLATDSTGVVSVDDNGASLTTDQLSEIAPDAAFPATTLAIATRASTAKPAAQSADGDATGIWTSRDGSVRTLGGEVAYVTSATFTADLAAVAANAGNRLVFVSVRETAGATAVIPGRIFGSSSRSTRSRSKLRGGGQPEAKSARASREI